MNKRKIKDKYFIERLIKVCTAFLMILSVFFVNKKLIVNEVHAESNTRIEYAEVIEEKYKSITVSASWVMMLGGSGMHSWNWAWVDLTSMTAGMDDMDWHKWEHLIWENDSSAIVSDTRVGGGWVVTGTTIEETHTFSYNDNLVSTGVIHKNAEAISLAGADLHPSVSYDFYRGSPETGTGNTTGSYDIVYDGGVSTFNFNHNSTRTTEEPVLRIYASGAWESPRMDWGGGKLTNVDKKEITSAEYMVERKKTTYQRTVTDYYTPKVKIGTGTEVGGQIVASATSGTTGTTAPDIEVLVGSTWTQNIALADVISVKSGYTNTPYNGYGGTYPGTFSVDDSAITAVLVGGKFAVSSLNQAYEISYKAVDADGTWTVVKRKVVVKSSLQSNKNANVSETKPGDIFTYYIPIKNNAVPATVDVTDTIHSGLEIISASNGGVVAGQTITWSNLNVPGESSGVAGELILSVVVKVKPDNNGIPWKTNAPYDTLDNTATVTEKTDPLNPVVTNPSTPGPQVVPDKKDKEVTSAPTMGAYYNIGDTISYKINFKNEDGTVKDIKITDDVPLNTELVSGSAKAYNSSSVLIASANITEGSTITYTIPNVAAGDSGYVVFDVKVKENAFGTTIKNKAKIVIGNDNVVITTNTTESPIVNKKSSANLSFASEGEANQGGIIKYTINYEIPEGKSSVHIRDDIPTNALYVSGSIVGAGGDDSAIVSGQGQLKWDITGLNPGDKGSVGFTIKVPNNAVIGTYIKNSADIGYDIDPLSPTNETNDKIIEGLKQTDKTEVKPGDIITYKLLYQNASSVPQQITITDIIPANTTYVENSAMTDGVVSGSELVFDGTKLVWTIDNVPSGHSGEVTFKVTVNKSAMATTIQNIANYGPNDPTTETNPVEAKVVPAVKESKIEAGRLYADDVIEYTINYKFPDGATSLTLTDVIPANTKYISGTVSGVGADDSAIVNGTGTLKWVIPGASGDSGSVSFKVRVNQNTAAGIEIKNKASYDFDAANDPWFKNGDTNETVDKVEDDIKKQTESGDHHVGDILKYEVEFENTGSSEIKVTVTDAIPEGTVYVPGSAKVLKTDGSDWDDSNGVFTINYYDNAIERIVFKSDNLAVGAKGKVYFEVRIDESALGTTVLNKAIIDIGEGSNRITYHSNTTKTPVNEKDSFIENIYLFENEIIDYTIGYEFPFGAKKLIISDVIPANTTYVVGSITGIGADDSALVNGTGTLKWEITGNEGDKGFVTFKVKVNEGTAAGVNISNKAKQEFYDNANVKFIDKYTNETVDQIDDNIKKLIDAPANVGVGDTLTYSIAFENFETVNSDLNIKDIIPNGTSFVEGSMKVYKNDGVSDWDSNDGVFIGSYDESTKTVEWNCTNLLPSAKGVVVFKVKVEKEAVGTIIDNVASYELGLNKYNSNHVKTNVKQNKASVIGDDKGVLQPGGEITYYVGYRNTENSVQDIVITDVIPANTKYITGSATGSGIDEAGITSGTGTLRWVINNVAPNESGYVTFKVKVDDNAADGVQVENEAEITIGTNAPHITNKTIDIVNPKTSSITHHNPAHTNNYIYTNDKLTYEIKYINNTLNNQNITVSDAIPFKTVLESMPAGATGYDKNNVVTVVLKDVVRLEWTFSNVAPNTVGSVTFDVTVTAKEGSVLNLGHIKIGDRNPIVTNEVINKFEPKKPNFTTPDKYLVTFLDCQGNTVKVEWVKPNTSATPPTGYGVYEGYINVSSHRDLKPTGCGIKVNKGYKVPKTGQTDNDLIWYITLGMGCVLLGLIRKRNLLKK